MMFKWKDSASISITLEGQVNQLYRPGESIKGTVCLHVMSPSSAANDVDDATTVLVMDINGEEVTAIFDYETVGEITRRSRHKICHASTTLASFNKCLVPGKHEYPFTAKLPPVLPSSMMSNNTPRDGVRRSNCSIQYSVRCRLYQTQTGCSFFCSDEVSSERYFLVVGSTECGDGSKRTGEHADKSVSHGPSAQDVVYCGLLPQGNITLGIKVEKSVLTRGEAAKVDLVFEHDSTPAHIESVSVQVREHIFWKAEGRSESQSRILSAKDFENPASMLGGPCGGEWIGTGQEHGNYCVSLVIPPTVRDSYSGKLIRVTHDVRVKVTTLSTGMSNPETIVPIKIEPSPTKKLEESPLTVGSPIMPSVGHAHVGAAPTKLIEVALTEIPEDAKARGRVYSGKNEFKTFSAKNNVMSVFTACLG